MEYLICLRNYIRQILNNVLLIITVLNFVSTIVPGYMWMSVIVSVTGHRYFLFDTGL